MPRRDSSSSPPPAPKAPPADGKTRRGLRWMCPVPREERVVIRLHRAQHAFAHCDAPVRGYVGGIGSGKSWVGAYDMIRRAMRRKGLYAVYAPTYPLMRDATLRSYRLLADTLKAERVFNKGDSVATLGNGSEIIFRSLDDYERARGPNLTGAWIDEASLVPREAYDIILGRLRGEGGEQMGWLSCTFTPKGRGHWTYAVFGSRQHTSVRLFHSRTADNPFLPPQFVETVAGQYTSAKAKQELGGEFIVGGGKLFNRAWFRVVEAPRGGCKTVVRYWDKAGTDGGGCYTAGVKMGRYADGRFVILHVVRGQWSAGTRAEVMKQTATADGKDVDVWTEQEPGSGGKESAENTILDLAGWYVRADKVTGDKAARAEPLAAQAERGNVDVVSGPWTEAFLDELDSYPDGDYVDQMDAAAGALNKLVLEPEAGSW